ncbi:MAG: hypothetical protein IKF68_05760, partial [Erysipelotrichaceae bacterium]|nr:hypothetical protein [Erysipelotrichaceae bacterium]
AGKKEAVGNILREAIEANRPEIDKYCEVYHLTMNDMPQRGFIAAMKDSETYTMPVYSGKESGYEESSPSSLEERRAYPLSYEEREDRALRGTLIHKAFELLDFSDPDIGKLDLPLSEEDKKAVMNFFGHDLVNEVKGMELHRELPYALMEDGQYMHGFMDLMAIDDRHIILIDYKSDKGKTRDEYLEAYSGQQNAYRKALKHFGLPIECYLYSLELDEFIRVEE